MHISIGAPQRYETQRPIYHPELRKGMGLLGFKGEKAAHGKVRRGNAPL